MTHTIIYCSTLGYFWDELLVYERAQFCRFSQSFDHVCVIHTHCVWVYYVFGTPINIYRRSLIVLRLTSPSYTPVHRLIPRPLLRPPSRSSAIPSSLDSFPPQIVVGGHHTRPAIISRDPPSPFEYPARLIGFYKPDDPPPGSAQYRQ